MFIDVPFNPGYTSYDGGCGELHIGNTPRSIMTKGNSISYGTQYGNFIRGNNDKLMISYRREPSHDYSMTQACGVLFEGDIHFFGGKRCFLYDHTRQHFVIETKRSGQLVKMTKKEDLEIEIWNPSCSSFAISSEYFPWSKSFIVILCFDVIHQRSCYSFDGKLTYIVDSHYGHLFGGGLVKYKGNLLTVGGAFISDNKLTYRNQQTEILRREDKKFRWSIIEPFFKFTQGEHISGHSLVTVESSDITKEYVLLLGGIDKGIKLESVFKFNGTWFPFGKLNKPRYYHNAIYWNGAIYVIGGWQSGLPHENNYFSHKNTKIEIWNIKDSPDQFKTKENWPELFKWERPHLFIVPDSFFPDH